MTKRAESTEEVGTVLTEVVHRGERFFNSWSDLKPKCAACRFNGTSDKPLVKWTTIDTKARTQSSVELHVQCAGTYFFVHSSYLFQVADESRLIHRGEK